MANNNTLPPPPTRTRVTMNNGTISPEWVQWFNLLYTRIGGSIATPIGDLSALEAIDVIPSHAHAISHVVGLAAAIANGGGGYPPELGYSRF